MSITISRPIDRDNFAQFLFCLYVCLCNKTSKDPTALTDFILVAPWNHGLHQVEISTIALRLSNSISHNANVISLKAILQVHVLIYKALYDKSYLGS